MTSSPSPRSRVYFTWRKTARNVAALLAFAACAFLGILGESIGSPQTRHICAFGLGALDLAFAAFLVRMLCREGTSGDEAFVLRARPGEIAFMNFVAAITTVAVLRRAIGLSSRLNVRTLMV